MADRRTPILTLPDGRSIYGLVGDQRTQIDLLIRRYFAWVDGGRRADPWDSGAGKGQSYQPRVKHGAPVGGYGPGTAAEPDGPDGALVALDRAYPALPEHQRRLLVWRYCGRVTYATSAERMGMSVEWCIAETTRVLTRLYYTVYS